MDFINFNHHIVATKLNVYGGSEKKRTVILDDGFQYLLKFPDPIREHNRNVSYVNNALSEYIGCRAFKHTGFSVQEVILGEYVDENNKLKIACACKDFCQNGGVLHEIDKVELASLEKKEKLSFDSVYDTLKSIDGIDAASVFQEYCDRFIIDCLIGNPDRHNGNWGLLEKNNKLQLAPVYDCGSSLSPLLSDGELLQNNTIRNEAINAKSVFEGTNHNTLTYRECLNTDNLFVQQSIKRIVPLINLDVIKHTINRIPYISNERKLFYNELIKQRYDDILLSVLEKQLGIQKSTEYKKWNADTISFVYKTYIAPFASENKLDKKTNNTNDILPNYDYTINNQHVFLMKNNYCVGILYLDKSNLNVCKSIQSLRSINIPVDTKITDFIEKKRIAKLFPNTTLANGDRNCEDEPIDKTNKTVYD